MFEFVAASSSAFLASALSAIAGLGGGLILYFALWFIFPLTMVIPLHGASMLISNASRVWFLRDHVQWRFLWWYMIGCPLGYGIALMWLREAPEQLALALLAVLILYSLFRPRQLPELRLQNRAFFWVGLIGGILGLIIGATGTYVKAFFNRKDLSKEQIVASEASLQVVTHTFKVPAFLYLGFAYQEHWQLIAAMAACALLGSFWGVKVLKRVPIPVFRFLFKAVLIVSVLRIFYALWQSSVYGA